MLDDCMLYTHATTCTNKTTRSFLFAVAYLKQTIPFFREYILCNNLARSYKAAGFENHEPYEKDGELNLQLKHNALLALYRLGQLSPEPEHGA